MSKQLPIFPKSVNFLLESPLYEKFSVSDSDSKKDVFVLKYASEKFDSYCIGCGTHSIFTKLGQKRHGANDSWDDEHLFIISAICSRDSEHIVRFIIRTTDETIEKIGQHPSIADLNLFDVKKYAKVLDRPYFQEFTKAIGLAAHGVGVGSFVYLRRIFENLIEEAHKIAVSEAGWDESAYVSARMADRIQMLSHYLPEFLVETKVIYGILSKGIHELSEQECLEAFPVVKTGIELILEEKLAAFQRQQKVEAAKKAIQQLSSQQ